MSNEQVAEMVGISRSAVTNYLRLLGLPLEIKEYLQLGKLTMGHARALLAMDPDLQQQAAWHIVHEQLSVRQVEQWAQRVKQSPAKNVKINPIFDRQSREWSDIL